MGQGENGYRRLTARLSEDCGSSQISLRKRMWRDEWSICTLCGRLSALIWPCRALHRKSPRRSCGTATIKTTLAHYTALRVVDTAQAVNQLPRVEELGRSHVVCTARRAARSTARRAQNTAPACANVQSSCDEAEPVHPAKADSQVQLQATLSCELRHDAPCEMEEAAEGNRTLIAGLGSQCITTMLQPQ